MNKYNIRITTTADKDMKEIYNYIAKKLSSPQNAKDQYDRIAKAILSLQFFPRRYVLFDVEPEHSYGLRKMVIDNYLVCYIVDEKNVVITDVIYGASNVHSKLINRH